MNTLPISRSSFVSLLGLLPLIPLMGCVRQDSYDRTPPTVRPAPFESSRLPSFERLWSSLASGACVMPSGEMLLISNDLLLAANETGVIAEICRFEGDHALSVAAYGNDTCAVALSSGFVKMVSTDGSIAWTAEILNSDWFGLHAPNGLRALPILVDASSIFVLFTAVSDAPASLLARLDGGTGEIVWTRELPSSGYDVSGVCGWWGLLDDGRIMSTVSQGVLSVLSAETGIELALLEGGDRVSGPPTQLDDGGYCLQTSSGILLVVDLDDEAIVVRSRRAYGGSVSPVWCNGVFSPIQIDDYLLCRVPLGTNGDEFGFGVIDIKSLDVVDVIYRFEVDMQPLLYCIDGNVVVVFLSQGSMWRSDIRRDGIGRPQLIADIPMLGMPGTVLQSIWNERKELLLVADGSNKIHCFA